MIIKGKDLIEGIKKANGVVGEGNVIEHLRGFKFNPRPDKGLVDIAGSDGRLTLLAQIPYDNKDISDGSILSLSSDKIKELVKHISADDNIGFVYGEDVQEVEITDGDYSFKTMQKEFENDFINFEYMEFNDFEDELNAKELAFILESLTPLARTDSADYSAQTVYLDKAFAFLFDGQILAKVAIGSKNPYVIDYKSAKQIQTILRASESEVAKIKFFEEAQQVLIRTEKDVLVYRVHDTEQIDISFADDFKTDYSFKVNRLDFVNSLARTKLATDEEEIVCVIKEGMLSMSGIGDNGEQAKDSLPITEELGKIPGTLVLLVDKFRQICGTIRTKEILIEIDADELLMKIHDTQGRAVGYMTLNIE